MNAFRSLLFVAWLYGTMTVMTLIGLPLMLLPRRVSVEFMRLYCRVTRFGLRWIMGIKVEIRGQEHIPEGPIIVAGTHQAMLDIFVPFLLFDDPMVVMKRELLWYPGFGWFALRAGMLPIDRNGTTRTMKQMLKTAKTGVETGNGRQIVIFPEGTRAKPGAPSNFKSAGIRALYKALNLPIVPVATNSGLCWPGRGILRKPGTVVYDVLPIIEAALPHQEMLPKLFGVLDASTQALHEEGLADQESKHLRSGQAEHEGIGQ